MKYPAADMANRIQGKVILRFKIVNKALDSVIVVNHVSPNLDAEATRVMLLTNGQWNLEENKTFLFALVFKLTADGVQSIEKLRADRDKAMQHKEYADALKYAGEIQRRDPFDITNLDILEEICTQFNAEDAKKQVAELKSQLLTIPVITKF